MKVPIVIWVDTFFIKHLQIAHKATNQSWPEYILCLFYEDYWKYNKDKYPEYPSD